MQSRHNHPHHHPNTHTPLLPTPTRLRPDTPTPLLPTPTPPAPTPTPPVPTPTPPAPTPTPPVPTPTPLLPTPTPLVLSLSKDEHRAPDTHTATPNTHTASPEPVEGRIAKSPSESACPRRPRLPPKRHPHPTITFAPPNRHLRSTTVIPAKAGIQTPRCHPPPLTQAESTPVLHSEHPAGLRDE